MADQETSEGNNDGRGSFPINETGVSPNDSGTNIALEVRNLPVDMNVDNEPQPQTEGEIGGQYHYANDVEEYQNNVQNYVSEGEEEYSDLFTAYPPEMYTTPENYGNNIVGENYNEDEEYEQEGRSNSSSTHEEEEYEIQNSLPQIFNYDKCNANIDWDEFDTEKDTLPRSPSIHISKMNIDDMEEASTIAEIIIELMEDDVLEYLTEQGIIPNSGEYDQYGMLKPMRKKISGDSISIDSNYSIEDDQPSTMRLYYSRERALLRDQSIPSLPAKKAVDAMVEANLHRSAKRFRKGPATASVETQTKVMALVTKEVAERVFWGMYPKPDDWKPPPIPARQHSMDVAVDKAEAEDNNVDKATIKSQIKRLIKKRILKPLPEDFYQDEYFWTGSRFRGQYINRQFFLGHFDFATGTTYESEFRNGHAQSRTHKGALVYPRGDVFEGQWRKGRYQAGEIVFADGLKYEPRDWHYCIPPDRRFKSEKILGVHPAGDTIYNDRFPPTGMQLIPPGCYDVGEGIYDPKTSTITGYDGAYLRDVTSYEHCWIEANCRKAKYPRERYIAQFSEDRLPGSSCEKRPCNN